MDNFSDLVKKCEDKNKKIYEIVQEAEAKASNTTVTAIRERVKTILNAMKEAIEKGLKSNEMSASGLCGNDCEKLLKYYNSKPAMFGKLYEKITTYALATIEENSRMGKIVACPTAGSCGIVPAVLIAGAEFLDIDEKTQIDALITAGTVGEFVAKKMALAGAVGGCQAECGVASAMAAAALSQMRGATTDIIMNSVALALKNIMGLTCDPVQGLVEVPCVKRNPFLAIHAVSASELAMAGIVSKIPIDEVVDAMKQVGALMSPLLKESSEGGLATTKTANSLNS